MRPRDLRCPISTSIRRRGVDSIFVREAAKRFLSPLTSGADGTSEISPPMNIPPFAPLSVPATTLAVTWTWPRLVSETFGRNTRLSARTSFSYLEPRGKLLESCLGQDIFYQWEHLPFLEADVLLQCFSVLCSVSGRTPLPVT